MNQKIVLKYCLQLPCLLLITVFTFSCGTFKKSYDLTPAGETHNFYKIDEEVTEDEEISAIIAPHVRKMMERMSMVLTVSDGLFEKAVPEGTLGNLAADIVRYRATTEMRETVHLSIMNNLGLRVPLPKGEITVGHIYQLIPFDNYITVLKFTGEQLNQIAAELAVVNGEPVSGIRFRVTDGHARDILLNSKSVVPDQHYWLATNDYLADGGGDIPTLWNPVDRRTLDVLTRDAIIEYLWGKELIYPYVDQRVRN